MARAAGVSRETAHKRLRDAGQLTFSQMHRLADEAGVSCSGEDRFAWFKAQGWSGAASSEST